MKIEGLAELQAKLQDLGAELGQKILRTAARRAFKPVLDAAKGKAPVDTGNLRDAIKIASVKPKAGDTVVAVGLIVTNNAPKGRVTSEQIESGAPRDPYYWIFAERGKSGQAAKPFLRPALDGNSEQVLSNLKKELEAAIQRAVKRKRGKK